MLRNKKKCIQSDLFRYKIYNSNLRTYYYNIRPVTVPSPHFPYYIPAAVNDLLVDGRS